MLLKIEFEEAVWQKVVDMLATQPYRDVGPIIVQMAQQFQMQQRTGVGNGQMEVESEALHPRN